MLRELNRRVEEPFELRTMPEKGAELSLNSYAGQPPFRSLVLFPPSGKPSCCAAIVVSGTSCNNPVHPYRSIRLDPTRMPRTITAALCRFVRMRLHSNLGT